jgi:methanogenic corrinoid protein MtbC1
MPVTAVRTDLGRRTELVSMDQHHANITGGLYVRDTEDSPVGTVHSYSGRPGEIAAALLEGEDGIVDEQTRAALERGVEALGVMDDGLIAGMALVGIKFRENDFIEAVENERPQLMGMSALLTTTMPNMGRTIEAFLDADLRDTVKIMVGGAPVTPEFAQDMGADGYGKDAMACVAIATELIGVGGGG